MSSSPEPGTHHLPQDEWAQWIAAPHVAGDGTAYPDVVDTGVTFGADDVLADQLSSLGAVGNTSDGDMGSDGTLDVDWTG